MSDRDKRLPLVAPELLDFLERLFPDACPSVEDTERSIWIAVGSARVVKKLRRIYEDQNHVIIDEPILDRDDINR